MKGEAQLALFQDHDFIIVGKISTRLFYRMAEHTGRIRDRVEAVAAKHIHKLPQ